MLRTVRTVIVDEIRAVCQQARAHLALSLERAAVLAGGPSSGSASRRRNDLSNSSLTFWAAVTRTSL